MSTQQQALTPEILVSRLGDYLVEQGLLSPSDLRNALDYQERVRQTQGTTPLLGQILLDMDLIDRVSLDTAITEQIIQLRSALEKANQRLEQRVQQRTAELENALAKLSELGRLKTNFVANISHELRTPLTHLKGYLELLLAQELGTLTADQQQALQVMQRSSGRLERLIEDLILFSTVERGDLNLRVQPFPIQGMCNALTKRFQARAQEHSVQLELDCESNLPPLLADEEKLSWAVQHLLDNAIKFSHPNGKVTLRVEHESKMARISVIDAGIGIAPERVEEIFEPFHQLDGSSTRKFAGTGIGLTLVKKIIEAHGSVLHVTSETNQGSEFSFLITTVEVTAAS